MSQIEVANFLKIPRSTYGHYETGNSKIPIDIFIQLCDLYKTTPNLILGFQSKDFPNLDSSKIYKLCSLIDEENIDVDQLIKLIKLSKTMYE